MRRGGCALVLFLLLLIASTAAVLRADAQSVEDVDGAVASALLRSHGQTWRSHTDAAAFVACILSPISVFVQQHTKGRSKGLEDVALFAPGVRQFATALYPAGSRAEGSNATAGWLLIEHLAHAALHTILDSEGLFVPRASLLQSVYERLFCPHQPDTCRRAHALRHCLREVPRSARRLSKLVAEKTRILDRIRPAPCHCYRFGGGLSDVESCSAVSCVSSLTCGLHGRVCVATGAFHASSLTCACRLK